jgi:hypothetical protein
MARTVPVGDGFGAAAFEQTVLRRSGGWSVRYDIACAAASRDKVRGRIVAFLRWLRSEPVAEKAP